MCMENLHWNIICAVVSGSLLQSWHKLQFGHPRSCSRSAVQIMFLLMSQTKNLHLGGAQFPHTTFFMLVATAPPNCALWAEVDEYMPLVLRFHLMSSVRSSRSSTGLSFSQSVQNCAIW